MLTVPVDYADPGRGSLDLAVIRVRAADQATAAMPSLLTASDFAAATPLLQAQARGSVVNAQVAGFEAALAAYDDRCSQPESCVPFGDPRALFDRVVRTARSTPVPSGRPVGDPPANAETVPGFLTLRQADDSGSRYDVIDSVESKTPERRAGGVDDAAFVNGCAGAFGPSVNLLTVSGGGQGHTACERSPCVAEHVTLYLVELRVPGGHAC